MKTSAGVTAFIDILGFGRKVLSADTEDDIHAIRKSVELIRRSFDHNSSDDLTRSSQQLLGSTVLAFSDSIIVNVPLVSDATKYSGTFDTLMSEISNFACAQGSCVLNGIFLRGGVDLGWWHQDGEIVISQSLTRAYKQEGECCFPMISVTKELLQFLQEHRDRRCYADEIEPVRNSFSKTTVGTTEFTYIDYIRLCLEALDWRTGNEQIDAYRSAPPEQKDSIRNDGYRHNVDAWLIEHAGQIAKAHKASSGKVRDKYVWLASYHNEAAKQYSKNTLCSCVLE
jgi:hypothetical protein